MNRGGTCRAAWQQGLLFRHDSPAAERCEHWGHRLLEVCGMDHRIRISADADFADAYRGYADSVITGDADVLAMDPFSRHADRDTRGLPAQ